MDETYIGSALTAACTVLGALPAIFFQNVSHRKKDTLLAYTAGIMVAASTYGLIPSALKLSNVPVLTIGILLGTVTLTILEKYIAGGEQHLKGSLNRRRALVLLMSMSIHNLPEGLSVGVSYASNPYELGPLVSFAMGLQNIPEGFLMALLLVSNGIAPFRAFLYVTFTGLLELFSAAIGITFAGAFAHLIPYGLAFAAGSMLFVVYKDLIPESHGDGNEQPATFSFIFGLLTMISLTQWLR
ncbi:ZIP family metal transporter [Ectobacillus ponti]|uniref:ZIP family metal transporter n=1 Tax=Ectobacillus ponti TaxID=2961894 RepID=A0AA42BS04_9BACI|nr:ZIP family metal transporter [Ectobacillus ponti]MCP8970059.1 ZIP family metal transporter [Ectobacillus ponti]